VLNRTRSQPRPPAGLVGNAGALLGSRLARAALGWTGTVLIARSLSLDEFGRFTLIFTVLALMSVVTDMGIGRLAVRGMLDQDDPGFAGSYLVLRTLMGVVGYGVALLVVVAAGYPAEVVQATAVAGLVIVLATPSSALEVVFQAKLRMGTVGVAETTGMVAQVALTAAIAAAGGTVLLFTIPAILYEVLVLVWKARAARHLVPLRPRVDVRSWLALLREAVPLSVGFGLATVYARIDSLMLSKLVDFEAVGIYGVSYKFIDVTHSAATAVTVPLLTLLVQGWPGDLPAFRSAVRRGAALLALVTGLAVTGLVGFAEPLTALLYGREYAVGADTTRMLAGAELFASATALAMCCLVACGRHRHYPVVMVAGLALNIGLNLVLIPELSYFGAAITTLVTNAVVAAVLWRLFVVVPGVRPLGLARLAVLPVAVGAALAVGALADLAVPWVLAAALASATYVLLVVVLGLTAAAGIRVPGRGRRSGA
jgi:O-antigen/teichoic acid export membrane protein